jgi:ABC-2 type transport system ATP-binding protein
MKKISKRFPALQVHNLRIRRSASFELRIDSLWVDRGSVLCVAGANGGGKTTLIETIVGLIPPGDGHVRILGQEQSPNAMTTKNLVGFIPDDDSWIIPELTAQEYFSLLVSLYDRSDAGCRHEMNKQIGQLAEVLMFSAFGKQLGELSHGNKKKVQIIAALIHQPPLLIVDELRNGLDPIAITRAEELLKSKARKGTAILAATHDLWWAERFAHDIVMLDAGRVVLEQSTAEIIAESGSVESKFIQLHGARSG